MANHEIEKIIRQTRGSFAVDGMHMDEESEDRIRRYLNGEVTVEEARAEMDAKYGQPKTQTA